MSSYQGYRCGGLHRRYSSVPTTYTDEYPHGSGTFEEVQILRTGCVLHTVGIILCTRINTSLYGLDTGGTFAGRDKYAAYIYISSRDIYIHTKQDALRIK